MSNHVKILARCDFSLWRRQRHKTYHHDIRFLPLGRRSAITIGHEMVLHIVSFRQSRRSSSLALYNHSEHHWKRGTRVLAACKIVTANRSKPEGRSYPRTTAATVLDNRVDASDIWNAIVTISECAQTSWRANAIVYEGDVRCAYPSQPIIQQNAF